MDGFEMNKTLMAVILALLIGMISAKIGDILVHPQELAKNAYVIEGVDTPTGGTDKAEADEKVEPIEPLLAKANVENGAQIAKKCLQCHSLEKGGAAKVGPNLWNIVQAKFAHMDGFSYSQALQEKKDQWTYENLNHFLHRPKEFIKGTKMTFAGLKKAQDRADIIAYLRTLSDNPAPLPAGK